MADVDANGVAKKGIQDLQGAIDRLNAAKIQPGADIPGIVQQIEALQRQQAALRDLALGTIQDTKANKQAIAAISAAAASLTTEAGKIKNVATALSGAAKIVTAVASLVTALTPFV